MADLFDLDFIARLHGQFVGLMCWAASPEMEDAMIEIEIVAARRITCLRILIGRSSSS